MSDINTFVKQALVIASAIGFSFCAVAQPSTKSGKGKITNPADTIISPEDALIQYHAEYDHLNQWLDRQLEETATQRAAYWEDVDLTSPKKYAESIAAKREKFGQLLGVPQQVAPLSLEPQRTVVYEDDSLRIESVRLNVLPGLRVQGYLAIPYKIKKKKAAVICLHGANGSSIGTVGLNSAEKSSSNYGWLLAKRGYVTFSPHMSGKFIEQTQPRADSIPWGRNILHRKAELLGWSITGVDLKRFQRCLDFLEALPEVDPERIGAFGISRGGEFALHLAAYDTRIKASVSIGWFNDRLKKNTLMPGGEVSSPMYFITRIGRDEFFHPGMLKYFGDAEEGWLTAPRAIMIQNGIHDKNMYAGHAHPEFYKLHSVYEKLGIPEKAVLDLPDVGHSVSTDNSFPFLDKWLKHIPHSDQEN